MPGPHAHLRAYTALLIVLLLVTGYFYAFYSLQPQATTPAASSMLPPYPSNLPQLRPQDSVSQQQPFQYVVSYIDSGFQPASLTVQAGQTIRFINNGTDNVTIAGPGGQTITLAPGGYFQWQSVRGASSFSAGSFTLNVTAS